MPCSYITTRDWSLGIQQRISRFKRFFYAHHFSSSYYVGLGEALERVAGSVVPVDQPYSVRHHDWSLGAGFKT